MPDPQASTIDTAPWICPRCHAAGRGEQALTRDRCVVSGCGFALGTTARGAPVALAHDADAHAYYEAREVQQEYLWFHYPPGNADPLRELLGERAPVAAERFPWSILDLLEARPAGRALDVGCAVGAMTLALARTHADAIGLDRSPGLIDCALEVLRNGEARYETTIEGALIEERAVAVPRAPNASFLVGDALCLPFESGAFDTVIALNLLDRVPDPTRALDEVARAVAVGGQLVIASPYTWLERFTPRERWLGGFSREGRPVRGFESVAAYLAPSFALERERRSLFFIPHHARSGQLGLAHVQAFRRTA